MPTSSIPKTRRRPWRRRLAITLLAVPAGLLFVEGGLRFLLFSDMSLARSLGDDLRLPAYFAREHNDTGEAYWKLSHRLLGDLEGPAHKHPSLGWRRNEVDAETYRHGAEARLAGRRPVLLFGSSHARNNGDATVRYASLLARSELGKSLCMLNYATSAYGLCQSLMLLERSLPAYADMDPIVLFSVMIDRDLDRAMLGIRQVPQPKFIEGERGQLEIQEPTTVDLGEYLRDNPIGITSYAWNFLVYSTTFFNTTHRSSLQHLAEAKELRRRVLREALERTQTACNSAGAKLVVVIQQAERTLVLPEPGTWQKQALIQDLNDLDIAFVSSAPFIREAAAAQHRSIESFYFQEPPAIKHPNDDGMRVQYSVFEEAIKRGLTSH